MSGVKLEKINVDNSKGDNERINVTPKIFVCRFILPSKSIPNAATTAKLNEIIAPPYHPNCSKFNTGRYPIQFTGGTPIIFIMKKIATVKKNNGVYLCIRSFLFFRDNKMPKMEKNNADIPT